MIVDGRSIAKGICDDLHSQVSLMANTPRMVVLTCAPNFETKRFMHIKRKKAEEVGIDLTVTELPADITESDCILAIKDAAKDCDGIVVQLPFPEHIDRNVLVDAIPSTHDVDAFLLLDDEEILPPVVGAIEEILRTHAIEINGRNVAIIGQGRLVGKPAAAWFAKKGAIVRTLTIDSKNLSRVTGEADIIVLGAGSPGLLKPDMIREGVIILDAGTSEEGGELKGDADQECSEKASLFTPVPGGIGPITIAVLLRNLVTLAVRKHKGVV